MNCSACGALLRDNPLRKQALCSPRCAAELGRHRAASATTRNRTAAAVDLLSDIAVWAGRTGTDEKKIGAILFRHPGFVALLRKRLTVSHEKEQAVRALMAARPEGVADVEPPNPHIRIPKPSPRAAQARMRTAAGDPAPAPSAGPGHARARRWREDPAWAAEQRAKLSKIARDRIAADPAHAERLRQAGRALNPKRCAAPEPAKPLAWFLPDAPRVGSERLGTAIDELQRRMADTSPEAKG